MYEVVQQKKLPRAPPNFKGFYEVIVSKWIYLLVNEFTDTRFAIVGMAKIIQFLISSIQFHRHFVMQCRKLRQHINWFPYHFVI